MHPTKKLLIQRNGLRCMLCGKQFEYRELNWHHIIPKYVFRHAGEPIDNSYDNGALLCLSCHAKVHEFLYWDDEYQVLMEFIEANKFNAYHFN